jgi:hypothetical protein
VAILAGVLLVLAEVVSSQVLLSQIGNFLIWSGSAVFAWLLVRGEVGAPAGAGTGEARSVLASAVLQALAGLDALFDCQVAQILTSMCG